VQDDPWSVAPRHAMRGVRFERGVGRYDWTMAPARSRRAAARISPATRWARRLGRTRPHLVEDVLAGLAGLYGVPSWRPRTDPVSELVTTILSQNTSDANAERAFLALRDRYADWAAVEAAPTRSLAAAIKVGGLAAQKAPRIKAALRAIRVRQGSYDLSFLAEMAPLAARDWLTAIPGIGPKTASIVMLFCFGRPLMPVDTHVERVSKRIGLLPPKASLAFAHDAWLELVAPERMYEAHVALIRHGRGHCDALRPDCERCPVRVRCRFASRRAP
jgi:endonuclease-3